ncbi:Nitrate transporter 1.3 [Acorus gramineus]|uniref:Nitrate transporter 1.3 n=1 Tax=Acorus gramineus TaxID=55184 RepID=A0AAV9B939_ACOGR|nr:Nitrate transporter 1.3 [Acorus gramineus]KAK1272853.1 Nitrate transporter 1.3 [Acorus gramineus]
MTVDYRGEPADKSKTGGWLAAGLILGSELSERVCVMGISMNLVTYLVGDLHLSTSTSATTVTNFMGTLNLLALLGGFLADAKLGRYVTVTIFATITALGASLLTLATTLSSMKPPPCDNFRLQQHECVVADGRQLALLYAALYTIALGGGGIKANVSGFGSDQFDNRNPKEQKKMIFFFNRFYFCISLGSLFSVTVLVYIQDYVGRGWGYGISAVTMVVAVLVLLCGTPVYRYRKPRGSPLTVIWRVLYMAWMKRKLEYPSDVSQLTTVTQVEEVKMIIKLLPIWSTCILFWTVYSQMNTFSVEQATYMNRTIVGSASIPAGSLSVFLFISILLFTSLNEKVLVPIARRFTKNSQGITSLQRVAVGLVFSMAAMVVAGVVERQRREFAVRISVFWLVPQFFLVGAGEAFAYVGQLEFFIREAPERMKSMSTGLFLTTLAMGFFVSSLLVSLVDKATGNRWIKNNLNNGRLDYFYWMLAILGVINFFGFLFLARLHEYKAVQYAVDGSVGKEMSVYEDQRSGEQQKEEEV